MEMTVKEVLIAARAKIADPANWTQGMAARNVNGTFASPTSDFACRWCALGALGSAVKGGICGDIFWRADISLSKAMGMSTYMFNDTHTHAEVLAKFDEAIAAQGGE